MPKTRKIVVFGLIFVVSLVLIVIYGSFNPEEFLLFPKCPFKFLTTFDCPGCGSQRAVHHLLNLNIGGAIRANALLVFAIPYILLLIFLEIRIRTAGADVHVRTKKLHNILHNPKAIWIVFGIIVVWWILRNF
jgi:hypothetical protein